MLHDLWIGVKCKVHCNLNYNKCKIKGDFPLTSNHWFFPSCYSKPALFSVLGFVFIYDKQHAVLRVHTSVCLCFHTLYYQASGKTDIIKVIQWWPVLPGLTLDSCFRPSSYRRFFQWAVQLLSPRQRWLPPLWLLKNICRLSDPAGWTVSLHSLCTFLTARCVGLYFCQIKAQWIRTEIIVSPSLHLVLLPCCCNGHDNRAAASKQPLSIQEGGGAEWGADYPDPLLHAEEGSTQLITQTWCSLRCYYCRIFSGGRRILWVTKSTDMFM